MNTIKELKQNLRKEITYQKKNLLPEVLYVHSAIILEKLENHPLFQHTCCIALYHALPDEVQTAGFIEKWAGNKTILLPVIEGDDICFCLYQGKDKLKTGFYGICEPHRSDNLPPSPAIDLMIVPGIAFDRNRNRMGRGKGYYDRFLCNVKVHKIGLCFDFQLFDSIPADSSDIKMDIIITEKEIVG